MLYYVGKGTEFKKEECKEYKTIQNALKAAAKDEALTVWDETGKVIGSLTDNVPEGALQTNPDGSVNAYDVDGNKVGTVNAATVAAVTGNTGTGDGQQDNTGASGDGDSGQQGNVSESDTAKDEVIIPQGTMKVTVVCDCALNLRRSAAWGNENICGRAMRGQTYYVKAIHTVAGKKMVETIDGIFLSGQSEHVQFEQL